MKAMSFALVLLCALPIFQAAAAAEGAASVTAPIPGTNANSSPAERGDAALAPMEPCPPAGKESSLAQKTGILRNLRHAIDTGSLLQPRFYAEQMLSKFFCASKFKWSSDYATSRVTAGGFGDLYETSKAHQGLSIYITFSDREMKARIQIPQLDPAIDANAVIAVFGKTYELENPYADDNLQHPHLLGTPTSSFGNKALIYRLSDSRSDTKISALMTAEGSVQNLIITQQGRK